MFKKIVSLVFLSVLSVSLFTGCEHRQSYDVKIDKEQFKITAYDNRNETFIGKNLKSGTDKDKLFFSVDDIEGDKRIHVGDKVNAFYAIRNGEDSFIYVSKNNKR